MEMSFHALSAHAQFQPLPSIATLQDHFKAHRDAPLQPKPLGRQDKAIASTPGIVQALFRLITLLGPRRVVNEELGDALEQIHQLQRDGEPRWRIYLKMCSAIFWVGVNIAREISSVFWGKPPESRP
jgi:hypothetical protein